MSAHTPGSWKVNRSDAENMPGIWVESDDFVDGHKIGSSAIALIPDYWVAHEKSKEANARLIAAAPELLAVIQNFIDTNERNELDAGAVEMYIEEFRRVIAKAEGKS